MGFVFLARRHALCCVTQLSVSSCESVFPAAGLPACGSCAAIQVAQGDPQSPPTKMMALVVGFALALWGMTLLPEYPFLAYPRSLAMVDNILWQINPEGKYGGGTQVLKLMTFPTGSPKVAVQFQLNASGRADRIENI